MTDDELLALTLERDRLLEAEAGLQIALKRFIDTGRYPECQELLKICQWVVTRTQMIDRDISRLQSESNA